MRYLIILLLLSSAGIFAQQPVGGQEPATPAGGAPDTTDDSTTTGLAGQFLQHNFVNLYAFANAIYQSAPYVYGNTSTASFGGSAGGGIDLFHQYETGLVSLAYRGSYTDYSGSGYESGSNQSLAFITTKRLSARWSFSLSAGGGISLYGTPYYGAPASGPSTPIQNPFSDETRYLSSTVVLSYRQTRRLSYAVSGAFFLSRYTGSYGIGTTGVVGAISTTYRLTARTSLSGTYSHDVFYYQQNFGSTGVDSVFATVSHKFTSRTRVTVSGGVAHAGGSGTALLPLNVNVNGQTIIVEALVPYKQSSWVPDFQGSLIHNLGRFTVSVAGGQSVSPGNGVFLASRELFLRGYISRVWGRSNLSAGGGYIHIVSTANSIKSLYNGSYNSANFTVSYGYRLRRFLSAQAGYSYYSNSSFGGFAGFNESRIYVGLTFSTKGIPLTLF